MIQVIGGKIFIKNDVGEMIETANPELIGYAILDFVSNGGEHIPIRYREIEDKENSLKEKYISYLNENKLSFTTERKFLIDIVLKIDDFEPYDLISKASKLKTRVVPATCYNFLQTCVAAGILEIQPKKYIFKS